MSKFLIKENYYTQILNIAKDYLGPSSELFICRQIKLHLKKDPNDLQKSDIPTLAIRIRSGLLVLTHDNALVDDFFHRLIALADE